MEEYQEGDLLLCTVDKIEKPAVFVKLPNQQEGTIMINEIAPGRIRNLRDYVVPNKKIVCKVLRIMGDHIDLSLRRVSSKERKEVLEKYKQEQASKAGLKQILKEQEQEIREKILQDFPTIFDFFIKSKENPELIEKYIPKEFHPQVKQIIDKKKKDIEITKIINIQCFESDGIKRIKKLLSIKNEKLSIKYLAAGKLLLTLKAENFKQANTILSPIIEEIEKSAKKENCEITITEKDKK
jgi:translation initiation factor 2 alpha subunit (eIF-2alpha)